MSFKKKWLIIILVFLFAAPTFILADCTKSAKGYASFALTYKVRDENRIKSTVNWSGGFILERDGRYNGGCRTAVGRQKARRRAIKNTIEALKQHFANNTDVQINFIKKALKKHNYYMFRKYPELKRADWIKIDRLKLIAYPKDGDGPRSRDRKEVGINPTRTQFKLWRRVRVRKPNGTFTYIYKYNI